MLMQKPTTVHNSSKKRSSLRIALFFDIFFLLTITVIATAVGGFFLAKSELTLRTVSELEQAVQERQEFLTTAITKEREELSRISEIENPSDETLRRFGMQTLLRLDAHGNVLSFVGTAVDPDVMTQIHDNYRSLIAPIFIQNRWTSYAITAPNTHGGKPDETIVGIYPVQNLSSRLFSVVHDARSKEILLVLTGDHGEIVVLTKDARGEGARVFVDVGSKADTFFHAVRSAGEGYSHGTDYAGIKILGAYKTMPTTGWTIMATIDEYNLSSAILRLAVNIAAIGLAFVGLLSLSTFALAKRITEPLEQLSKKLNGLEARHWHYERSIYSGNELESVDEAGFDLTQRLRSAHDHLEDIVRERTEALRKKLSENETILASIDYGIFVTNDEGKIVYTNTAGEKLVGRKIEHDEKPTAIGLLKLVNKDGALLLEQDHPIHIVLREGVQTIPTVDPEYSIRIADDKDIPVQVRVSPILQGKKCVGVVAVIRDTTEERRIDRIKSEFISLVSHQLRTPLSSMRWYLEMLATKDAGPLTTDQEEFVREASTSNARMVHLVNGLLNVSRLEMGKMQKKTETVDIEKIIRETADTFTLELKQKNIALAISAVSTANLPVTTDRGLLQLIIENFLSNAIKYSKEGTTITLNIVGDMAQKTVTISVTDTGIGIPMEQREFIGRRLFRGTNARLENTDGNGLGLYISTIAAEAIGAALTFDSKENEGSTFLLVLPVVRE